MNEFKVQSPTETERKSVNPGVCKETEQDLIGKEKAPFEPLPFTVEREPTDRFESTFRSFSIGLRVVNKRTKIIRNKESDPGRKGGTKETERNSGLV